MSKLFKTTAVLMLIGLIAYVSYDIIVVNVDQESTISKVMFFLLKFPFIIYAWSVLGGHFISPKQLNKRSIPMIIILSSIVLVLSILSITNVIVFNSLALCVLFFIGFFVGAIFWNQRSK
jgi:hypothetical protein